MATNVWGSTPESRALAKADKNLRGLYVLHHLDRFAAESAVIVREFFPSRLKMLPVGVVNMPDVSRARQHGGCLAKVAVYMLGARLTGQPREVADRAIGWLEGIRDFLWGEPGVPSDEEIRAAALHEQEAENAETVAQLMLQGKITRENLERALEASEAEIARQKAFNLLLRRRIAAER